IPPQADEPLRTEIPSSRRHGVFLPRLGGRCRKAHPPHPLRRLLVPMRKAFAEFLGTFVLVFAGTGAIVVDEVSGGVIGHAGIALTFGLVVLAMIHAF